MSFQKSSSFGAKSAPSLLKSKKIQKKKRWKGKGPVAATPQGKGKTKVTDKGKCFHYNVDGHQKRNCPKYLAKKKKEKEGKYDLLFLETCLVENDQKTQILDLVATNHVCFSLQENSSIQQLEEDKMMLKVGTGGVILAHAVGDVKLFFVETNSCFLETLNIVPKIKRNLIFVSLLIEQLY